MRTTELTPSCRFTPEACAAELWRLDRALAEAPECGETTLVLVVIADGKIFGASVGDSGAWTCHREASFDLTAGQHAKPLLGSNAAHPVSFGPYFFNDRILIASPPGCRQEACRTILPWSSWIHRRSAKVETRSPRCDSGQESRGARLLEVAASPFDAAAAAKNAKPGRSDDSSRTLRAARSGNQVRLSDRVSMRNGSQPRDRRCQPRARVAPKPSNHRLRQA